MKLSACNQIKDKVVEVRKGATTARVRIDIGNGLIISSSITNEAGEDLGIGGWRRDDRHHQGFRRNQDEIAPMRINRYPQAGRAVSTGALRLLAAIAVALLLVPGGPVTAADQSAPGEATASGSGIMLDGKVKHPQKLTVGALHKFPADGLRSLSRRPTGSKSRATPGCCFGHYSGRLEESMTRPTALSFVIPSTSPVVTATWSSFPPARSRRILTASRP